MLEKEYDYFLKNKNSLIQKYENRFVVIVGEQVTGDYESEKKALEEATKSYKLGTFLIQKISRNEADYIQKFHSRVYV